MDGSILLSVRGASRIYRMGEVDVPALRDVSLDLNKGELLIICGQSGSGKSTLLNLIGGMDRPTSGSIRIGALDLARARDSELTQYRRHSIGFVFQFYNLVPTLTAIENVQVATEMVSGAMDPLQALESVNLADRADHFPAQLSGGEQQRVSIARALAKNPLILLCDEPTGALDTESGTQVLRDLVRFKSQRGQTVVLITHNPAIARIGDRIVTLKDGLIASIEVNERPLSPDEVPW